MRILRELAISADLAAWAGDEHRCTALIARIYDGYDNLYAGLAPPTSTRALAADAAAWIEGRSICGGIVGKRVLFAEDDAQIRFCTSELLRDEGFHVVEVEDGDTAASVLETQSFDLLLTDVRMPGSKDGFDLATYARRSNPTLPIVVITGYAENAAARIRDLGQFVALVRKPFTSQELVEAVLKVAREAPPIKSTLAPDPFRDPVVATIAEPATVSERMVPAPRRPVRGWVQHVETAAERAIGTRWTLCGGAGPRRFKSAR